MQRLARRRRTMNSMHEHSLTATKRTQVRSWVSAFWLWRILLIVLLARHGVSVAVDVRDVAGGRRSETLEMRAGSVATIVMRDIEGVHVEDENIAEASPLDTRNLVVKAKAPGATTLLVRSSGGKEELLQVRVSPRLQGGAESFFSASTKMESEFSAEMRPARILSEAMTPQPLAATPKLKATDLYVGAVTTLRLGHVSRIVVGNDAVLQASLLDNGDILVLGKTAGVSELSIWTDQQSRQQYSFRVYKSPPEDSIDLLRAVLEPFPDVIARQELGTNILTGTVDAASYEAFEKLVKGLPGVVSLVKPQLNIVIEKSIALDVRVLEVNRNYQKTVGIRWADTVSGPAFGVVGNLIPNNRFGVISDTGNREDLLDMLGAVGSGTARLSSYFGITSIIPSELQLLQEEGLARVLAAPSLSTVSGEKATFLAGGDLPVAVLNEFGQPVVEFRQYGIQLEIEPLADRFQNIRSKVKAEVSSVDFATQVNGVPGLTRRATTSTITARPGETIVISGLLDSRDSRGADKFPGLGEIPIIGSLFRSKDFLAQRTELIITVTPRIQEVNEPMSANLQKADAQLRKSLSGSEKLDRSLAQ